ncbi:amino acid ABC transporter permease [Herbaspirillum sp. GCM10030257]|uniref:amino acid ABC transporter permease n=1 Tax=Herbaspirillum sp. GCM10030257 TaxID=3273393 RepID=UPI00360EAD81
MTMLLEQIYQVSQYHFVLLKGIGATIALSAISIIVGTLLGFILGIGRASSHKWLSFAIGAYTDLFRGTPVLVQVFVVFFILPAAGVELNSFTAGAIALSNIAACFISEIIASGINAVPRGQIEAAVAAGLTRTQQLRLVVLPQAIRMVVPSLVGQFVLLVKDSSVVSAIGLLDLTRSGWVIVQNVPNGLLVFAVVGIGYFLICYPLLHLSRRLEKNSPNTVH